MGRKKADSAQTGKGVFFMAETPLVHFLYELIQNHMATGLVERLVNRSRMVPQEMPNRLLGEYAKHLADRMGN